MTAKRNERESVRAEFPYTIKEAARIVGLTPPAVWRKLHENPGLSATQVGRQWFLSNECLRELKYPEATLREYYIPPEEAARRLGMPLSTLYLWIRVGRHVKPDDYLKISRRFWFSEQGIESIRRAIEHDTKKAQVQQCRSVRLYTEDAKWVENTYKNAPFSSTIANIVRAYRFSLSDSPNANGNES